MKKSIYNTTIPIGGRYLIYNSFTNMYLIASANLMRLLNENEEHLLENRYPIFYSQLIKLGYFVEKENDEVALLKDRIRVIDNNDENYFLKINPTVNCNFRCWYCYEEHLPKSKMNVDILNRTKLFISGIASHATSLKSFNLSFFGGEPLLYFKDIALPIMEHYNSCCQRHNIETFISFTTNGYLVNDFMLEEFRKNKVNFFQITLDGCKEDHDATRFPSKGKGSYERIIHNIKRLAENQFDVLIRINYTAGNIGRGFEISDDLKDLSPENKKFISLNFQRVWQDRNEDEEQERMINEYIERFQESFNRMGFRATTVIPDFVRNSCYADKTNQILINYNGDLYKCTARDFNKSNKFGCLSEKGELILDEEKIHERCSIRFTKPVCHECRIAPLCGGGCTQKHLEQQNGARCSLGYTEKDKDRVIIDHFYNAIVLPNEISTAPST